MARITNVYTQHNESPITFRVFSGTNEHDTIRWLSDFNLLAQAHSYNPEKAAKVLPTLLIGPAKIAYMEMDEKSKKDYKQLCYTCVIHVLNNSVILYEKKFHNEDVKNWSQTLLQNRRQKPTETITVFVSELENLFSKAYPSTEHI